MRPSRKICCVQGHTGPADTLWLHSAASHVTRILVHNRTSMLGWKDERIHGGAAVSLLHGALRLFQICISNYSSLPPKFLSPLLFSITEDVTEFSHQHETFTGKSQVYFVQCVFVR